MTASGHIEAFPASTLNVGFEIGNPTLIGHTAPTGLRRKRSFRQRDQAAISLNSMVSGVSWTGTPRLGRPRPLQTDPIANLQCDLAPKKGCASGSAQTTPRAFSAPSAAASKLRRQP